MDAIQLRTLHEQLMEVRDKAIDMYHLQHPTRYNDYEIAAKLVDLGVVVRNGTNISRTVMFPPSPQHETNINLITAYTQYTSDKLTEVLTDAKDQHPRDMTNIVMQYTSDILTYKPQVKEVTNR